MSKTVTLQLSETEYQNLILCYYLGDLVKDTIEEKNQEEMMFQITMSQKLSKAAFQAKLKGAAQFGDSYAYSQEIENQMDEIFDEFKEYVASGEDAAETERIRKQIKEFKKLEKKKK